MVSSRETSPALASHPASPEQLTPTSKVRALLANFDDDSDEANTAISAKANLTAAFRKAASPNPDVSHPHIQTDATARFPAKVVEEDDEEDIVRPTARPLGRMAARMLAAEREKSASDETELEEENARTRVRKSLLQKKVSLPSPTLEKGANQDSEDSDIPVVSRKRKLKTSHHETPRSSPMKKVGSPGLFVSPTKTISDANNSSDSDIPKNPADNDHFKALVKQKREERLAREAGVAAEKAKKLAERKKYAQAMEEDEDDISDEDVDRRLTQPTRKASKKAQEEIRRETQRMSRNQQLTYKPTTKKKITRANLFAKFNFQQGRKPVVLSPPRPANSSSPAPQSDVEMRDTPPTSPESPNVLAKNVEMVHTQNEIRELGGEEIPTPGEATKKPIFSLPKTIDKSKGRAVEGVIPETIMRKKPTFTQRPIKIRAQKLADRQVSRLDDSDSDLEIVGAKTLDAKQTKLDSIFARVPAKQARESNSLHTLRMLAHLKSPDQKSKSKYGKNSTKLLMNTAELQMSLQQRARQQAAREREERLQALRDKGVIVQTAEEREKELAEVEDLLAKARQEGEEIMKREKAAAKKARKDSGEVGLSDSSDDEDWQEDKSDKNEQAELSLSGSEDEVDGDASDEEEDEDEEDEENEEPVAGNSMFDNEAGESDNDEAEANPFVGGETVELDDADDEEELKLPINHKQRRNKKAVISDDEDEEEQATPIAPHSESPMPHSTKSPGAPNSVLRSATKTFIPGLTVAGPAGLGLTQIFAGTMDDSQFNDDDSPTQTNPETEQSGNRPDAMAFLKRLPAPELLPFIPTMEEDTQEQDVIMDSQSAINNTIETEADDEVSQQIQLQFEQSQMHGFDSLVDDNQFSPFPEATQDGGFKHMTPIKGRFADPPSTIGTVVLGVNEIPETMEETPIVKKKGRLYRRAPVVNFSDDEDAGQPMEIVHEEDDFDISANAFDVMRKASKPKKIKAGGDFDKKNSKAKEMVHEQAEESEDEYAGLGGASDDESGGEADAFVKEMIDDEGGKDVDEGKLAAFFADRERASDEKQIEKLYNDISKGMLRRKRGADYDLSDSDDGGEAKRRRKRAQEAKMRKALLADDRIGKIAQNPKREAFLRAIEDRGSDDEMDFLEDFVEQEERTDSQSQDQEDSSQQVVPSSQPSEMGPLKRKHDDTPQSDNRPPPHLRRTKNGKKPTNLSEIRESLSSLIEEPNAIQAPVESESEDEQDARKEKENRDPFFLRRTKVPVIDRISLKRQSSSSISAVTKMAFAVSSAPGFKVPPLLRRATTNNSLASSTSSSVTASMSATERMAGGSSSDGVKRGGGKNSGVNYFAREAERKAAVVKTERRREVRMAKGAEVRRKVVGGLFGGGRFE